MNGMICAPPWEHTGKELLIAKQSIDGQEARVNKNPLPAP